MVHFQSAPTSCRVTRWPKGPIDTNNKSNGKICVSVSAPPNEGARPRTTQLENCLTVSILCKSGWFLNVIDCGIILRLKILLLYGPGCYSQFHKFFCTFSSYGNSLSLTTIHTLNWDFFFTYELLWNWFGENFCNDVKYLRITLCETFSWLRRTWFIHLYQTLMTHY